MAACRDGEISSLPYHPLGGKYQHEVLNKTPQLVELASRYGVSTYRLLLSWLLSSGRNIIPIPGATKLSKRSR